MAEGSGERVGYVKVTEASHAVMPWGLILRGARRTGDLVACRVVSHAAVTGDKIACATGCVQLIEDHGVSRDWS